MRGKPWLVLVRLVRSSDLLCRGRPCRLSHYTQARLITTGANNSQPCRRHASVASQYCTGRTGPTPHVAILLDGPGFTI